MYRIVSLTCTADGYTIAISNDAKAEPVATMFVGKSVRVRDVTDHFRQFFTTDLLSIMEANIHSVCLHFFPGCTTPACTLDFSTVEYNKAVGL